MKRLFFCDFIRRTYIKKKKYKIKEKKKRVIKLNKRNCKASIKRADKVRILIKNKVIKFPNHLRYKIRTRLKKERYNSDLHRFKFSDFIPLKIDLLIHCKRTSGRTLIGYFNISSNEKNHFSLIIDKFLNNIHVSTISKIKRKPFILSEYSMDELKIISEDFISLRHIVLVEDKINNRVLVYSDMTVGEYIRSKYRFLFFKEIDNRLRIDEITSNC